MPELVKDIVVGAIFTGLGVVLALLYENYGAPRLEVDIGSAKDGMNSRGETYKMLHLEARNVPKGAPLVAKQTASACRGTITFMTPDYHLVGQRMPIRWTSRPEPIKYEVVENKVVEKTIQPLRDNHLVHLSSYIDMPPTGDEEEFPVVIRFDNDTSAYGFTTESYFEPYFERRPQHEIPPGEYIVRVSIIAGDRSFPKDFLLVNRPETFRLAEFHPKDGLVDTQRRYP